ncbi:hypothetical protein [Aliarcobacter cibarius]|uniref:Putative membrane protein n=1 Tax=Aliarcobacter cibarius TaxID=255507 RepID=A0A5J6RKV5_9BACT|nr:hypothetical protein [Aliarcobacter cibarius]QEZ90203.1 putative membrane protein [Aliarcobacter cibarius]QKJ26276.1 putative membrane protein [Aliarcobacter cibarius]TLS96321.1 hypothetical protein FE247_10010 [Aliarcobacter cibarius]TLS96850.1 hypothetical protein FE245_10075 [Aliarcobacter cibarius]TLT02719.1 hypothetical protein FE248_09395 [Aliarcobacter cibarius]
MIFSKQDFLNIFNIYAIDLTWILLIASFVSFVMYTFLKRKILFKTSIFSILLSGVMTISFIYFNDIDLFLPMKMDKYNYNKMAEDIKNSEDNQKYQAFREFIDELIISRDLTKADLEGLTLMDKSETFKINFEIEVQSEKDVGMILKVMNENQ